MPAESTLNETKTAMKKAVEYMTHEFATVRTGKASPALVENLDVKVAAYGSTMKLKGLAVITAPEARSLLIQPFDPSTMGDIEKAIRESKLGLNPVADGRSVRLPIPELSEERRVELLAISNEQSALDLAHTPLMLPEDLPEWVSPIPAIIPAQLFCYYLTRTKGFDTEDPRGLSKVTRTW